MMQRHVVQHVYPPQEDRVRVKLIKNTKGYGWEISISGENGEDALASLRQIEQQMRTEYGADIKKPVGGQTPNGLETSHPPL